MADVGAQVGSAVGTAATVAAAVPGGQPAAGVLAIVAGVARTVGSLFRGSPPVEWSQANDLSVPTATKVVTNLAGNFNNEDLQKIFDIYTTKLKSYIKDSPHNPTQRDNFIDAVNVEAIGKGGGFKPEGFPFDAIIQDQFAWAIWLHAHWLYGGVSQDEVGDGRALKKFNDSLVPTLAAAIGEVNGQGLSATVPTSPTATTATGKMNINTASLFSNPILIFLLVGAVIFFLFKKG